MNSRCFCWFPAAILVYQNGTPIWRLHTKLYKGAWNVSANNSETVGYKDLRLGQIVYILVFYNMSFSWLLPLNSFQFIPLLRDSEDDLLILSFTQSKVDKQWWWDDGGGGGKDCEWKKRKSYHKRHHKLGLWLFNCFLSFALDLLKLSYCKMCLTISISVTLYSRDFLFVLISSHVEENLRW